MTTDVTDVVIAALRTGAPVVGSAGRRDARPALGGFAGSRAELAFPVVTVSGVLAVVDLRSARGLPKSETLTRVLGSIGRELGAFFAARPSSRDAAALSAREREVLELLADGVCAPEIAARLELSAAAARIQIRKVCAKLEVADRISAVVKAMHAGLIR